VLIVLHIFGLFLLTGNSFSLPSSISVDPVGVKKALLEIEYSKVGGKANYDIMTQAQQISVNDPQNPSNITAMKKYIAEAQGKQPTPDSDTPTAPVGATLSPTDLATILSGASLEGNASADIIAIEYSDMECPFCIKQYHDTKIQDSLRAQYGDKVAFAFKNNKWVGHPGTEAKAIGSLCAKKVGGDKSYAAFYHAIMDGTTQGNLFPVSGLPGIAKKIGLDVTKWQACVDNKAMATVFAAETLEAQKYGMSGTPGTLLINVKTGKYSTVEGAYPFSAFVEKIASIQ
jgi:predicted DsbA family dithiol-disulfide isomerase